MLWVIKRGKSKLHFMGMVKMKKFILWLIKSFSDCVFLAVMVSGLYLIARFITEHAAVPCLVWIIAVSYAYVKFYSSG